MMEVSTIRNKKTFSNSKFYAGLTVKELDAGILGAAHIDVACAQDCMDDVQAVDVAEEVVARRVDEGSIVIAVHPGVTIFEVKELAA